MKKKFKGIAVHRSESAFGNAQTIEDWHKENGWDDIGYHAVILNGQVDNEIYMDVFDGQIEVGRDWNINGAHVEGHNDYLGVCLVGVDNFTPKQFESLLTFCKEMLEQCDFSIDKIKGHDEFPGVTKICPGFDVSEIRRLLSASDEVWHG